MEQDHSEPVPLKGIIDELKMMEEEKFPFDRLPVSWDAPTRSTPLKEIQKLRKIARKHEMPIDPENPGGLP